MVILLHDYIIVLLYYYIIIIILLYYHIIILLYCYIVIPVHPLPGVEINSSLVNWFVGQLVHWSSGSLHLIHCFADINCQVAGTTLDLSGTTLTLFGY